MYEKIKTEIAQDYYRQNFPNDGQRFVAWYVRNVHGLDANQTRYAITDGADDKQIDAIEAHRHVHDQRPFTPELFDRWLEIFRDTVDSGWTGPCATTANKRATGMACAMAHRFLGEGWRPEERRA